MNQQPSSRRIIMGILAAVALIVLLCVGYITYLFNGQPSNSPSHYSVTIAETTTVADLANKLQKDHVILDENVFLLEAKLNSFSKLPFGTYSLNVPAKSDAIVDQLKSQSDKLIKDAEAKAKLPTVNLTFREGDNLDDIIGILVENNIASKDELEAYAKNPDNFDKSTYEFLPTPLNCTYGDIKNCAKYYPEGYLYPDTYQFFVPTPVNDIYDKFLSNFQSKVWVRLDPKPDQKTFQDSVILASVLEKETGRTAKGVTDQNRDEVNAERQNMAQVFINRTKLGMKWQSDVTAEYGYGRKLCQQTFTVPNCILLDDPLTDTLYNTYRIKKAPIAPVTNPQYDNIYASLHPINNNYLYFISDVTGKKYFYENETTFNKGIKDISQLNKTLQQ